MTPIQRVQAYETLEKMIRRLHRKGVIWQHSGSENSLIDDLRHEIMEEIIILAKVAISTLPQPDREDIRLEPRRTHDPQRQVEEISEASQAAEGQSTRLGGA